MRRALVLVATAVVLLVGAGPSSADVLPGCEGDKAPTPQSATDGISGVFGEPEGWEPGPRPKGLNSGGTDYETGIPTDSYYAEYGASGLQWHVIRDSCVDKIHLGALSNLTNFLWLIARAVAYVAISLYQWAMVGGLVGGLQSWVVDAVAELREGVWRPYLSAVVVLGAVWMAYHGLLYRRYSRALEGAGWMLGATVLAVTVIFAPAHVISLAGRITIGGADLAHTVTSKIPMGDDVTGCPNDWEPDASGDSLNSAVLRNSGRLWSGLLCRPWVAGEFGSGDNAERIAEEYGARVISAQAISRTTQHYIDSGEIDEKAAFDAKEKVFSDLSDQIEEDSPGVYATFEGERPATRLGVAFLALVAALSAGGLIFLLSIALLVFQVVFLLLILLSPLFLLGGIHPGAGRVLLLRWLDVTLGILIKQLFITFLLMLLVMAYMIVLGAALPWGSQMAFLTLFTTGIVVYRSKFVDLFKSATQAATPQVAKISQQQSEQQPGASGPAGRDGSDGADGASSPESRVSEAGGSVKRAVRRKTVDKYRKRAQVAGSVAGGPAGAAVAGASQQQDGTAGESAEKDPGGSGRRGSTENAPRLRGSGGGTSGAGSGSPASGSAGGSSGSGGSGASSSSGVEGHHPRERGRTAGDVRTARRGNA